MNTDITNQTNTKEMSHLDEKLSQRFIALDPKGYFIIRVDTEAQKLIVEHFKNEIDEEGRATDPETGKPIECKSQEKRFPYKIYKGQTAKEVGILLTESADALPISKLDHALYLGRELQKAEYSLLHGKQYIQD